ncbi:hypothetical protein LY90DRAFT_515973 [Neocallimastix californiae]|uniref:Uncharacterized protein n=1 Tax=Neocallimastix californiae TaxID=1754190 RepID=A0A1Y2AGG4_9FUNG|nr:hypothetical protein LY90DRAFT_515973 [Neocallimastix californiae]|eukprot:ORY21669.1 hypothetical protein LY90DRAFT_515973 [Neocallimastix californiae]
MDKKNKSNKAPENTRKTTRSGSPKCSVGSVTAESSPTPVDAPPSRRQNTGDKKMTTTPEKPAASKPKPAAAPEKSQPEASKPEASRPGTNQGESSSKYTNAGAMDFAALLSKQMEDFRNMILSTQQQTAAMIEQMQNQSEMRFAKIEAELSNFIPAVDQRFGEVERRVEDEESSSQASVLELQKVQAYLSQQLAESKDKEAAVKAEIKKIETYLDADQIKGKQIQQDLEDKGQKLFKIEEFLDANQERDKAHLNELEEKIEKLMAINQVQQQEIERLGKLALDAQNKEQASTSKPFPLHIDTKEARYGSYHHFTPPIMTRSAMEDVIMTDAYPVEYERDIPMFNGENGDDHLQGTAKKWYQMDEVFKQRDDPQPQRLMDRLLKEFKSERTLEEVKTAMLKLRHDWGKAYEYLSEFNRLSRILQLTDETKRLLLVQQVRPSVREAFYDLPAEKQTLEDYVTCLRRCDTFPADYKDDYLERYEYNRERKIAIMALLGMMDPRRPSKDIEAKRRRNSDNRRGDKRDFSRKEHTKQNNYDKNKKDGYNHNSGKDFSTRPREKQNYYKDSRTSSNNPIPKTALLMQAGSECEEFVPEAKISNLRTKEGLQDLNVLYDTGSQINMIHPQLAKEMGLKTEDRPLTFTTAAGKVLIPQVTEEFKIKIKLVEERTGKVKWYDFNTRCRLAEAMPRTIILGSRFMDRHLIYRKIDVHDQQPKVYKIDGERPGLPDVDSPEECAGESIYMVQLPEEREEAVQKEIQPTARITKIINQVIDNQKLKDTVYELTRQYYRDRGIEYTMDYYDYLVDYDKWADWFKVQKTKNLKES